MFSFDLSADFFRLPRHTTVIDELWQPLCIDKTQQTPMGRAIKLLSLNHEIWPMCLSHDIKHDPFPSTGSNVYPPAHRPVEFGRPAGAARGQDWA
jgi:hypothetical protein